MAREDDSDTEPLAGDGDSGVFKVPREVADRPWAVIYLAVLAFTVIGGIWTALHRDRDFFDIAKPGYLDDGRHCPAPAAGDLAAALREQQHSAALDIGDFVRHAGKWLVASAAGSLLVGVAFLQLFKHAAGGMTRATIVAQICIPLFAGIGGLAAGQMGPGFLALGMAALGALTFYLWRNEIALCAKLLGLSASALVDNPGLILFVIAAQIVNAVLTIGLLVLTMFAYEHGSVGPNQGVARQAHHRCFDDEGEPTQCCAWQQSSWSKFYMTIASITVLWTVLLFSQMRTFVTAGTVAQWYFSPPNSRTTKGTTMRMVRFALGTQFGTLCFASAVLVVVQMIRSAAEQARDSSREEGGNVFMSLLACMLECIASAIEFLTKFALIFSAIIGEPLIASGREAVEMLRRNLLKTIGVWWLPPMIVQFAAFTLSVVWGLGIYVASRLAWSHAENGHKEAVLTGVLSGGMALVVLSFCAGIILDIVDALFVCYATDRDRSRVTKAEVHEVYSQLPVGAVVEQPDGTRLYGAPAGSQSRVRYVPPSEQDTHVASV